MAAANPAGIDTSFLSEVIDPFTPSVTIKIEYERIDGPCVHGQEYMPQQTRLQPKISIPDAKPGVSYTIIMTDPDSPFPKQPKYREWLNLLIANIPGEQARTNIFEKSTEVKKYMGPCPPKGSGCHRYCFVAYEQKEKVYAEVKYRPMFKSREFARRNLLAPVGAHLLLVQIKDPNGITNDAGQLSNAQN